MENVLMIGITTPKLTKSEIDSPYLGRYISSRLFTTYLDR